MDDITTKLLEIENSLLAIDLSSVDDFNCRWCTFTDGFKATMATQSLSTSAIKAAYSLTKRVSHVAQSLLTMDVMAEQVKKILLDGSTFLPAPVTTGSLKPSRSSNNNPTTPSLVRPCHKWLMNNLQNPYPSAILRDIMARESGVLRKDVDKWFSDARTRIGWNSARKRFFSNKRAEIVSAATSFFTDTSPKLSMNSTVKRTFAVIEKRAKDLCDDELYERVLTAGPETESTERTPLTKVETLLQPPRQQSGRGRDAYPSPEHSPNTRNISTLEENDNTFLPPVLISSISRKRHSSFADPPRSAQDESSLDCRPRKRSKLTNLSTYKTVDAHAGLPSTPSHHKTKQPPEEPNPMPTVETPAFRHHKRRLSESFSENLPKRPRKLPGGPRAQVVSDPLPLILTSPEKHPYNWLQSDFDTNVLNLEELDPFTLDVQWGSLPELDFQSVTESNAGSPEITQQKFDLPQAEPASIFTQDSNHMSQTLDPLIADDFQSSLFNNSGINIVGHAPELSDSLVLSLDLNIPKDPYDLYLKPSLANLKTPLPSFDPTWDLLDFTRTESPDSVFDSAQPLDDISPVPELRLLTSGDGPFSLEAQVARAEKEKRLKEVQEEARRLELELATTV